MTPEEFEERWAHHLMSLGDEWQIGAMVTAMIHNTMERFMAAKAGKTSVARNRLIEPDKLIPRPAWYQPQRPQTKRHSKPEDLAKALGCI